VPNDRRVRFEVSGDVFAIDEAPATIMAENLRLRGSGQFGDAYGQEGATALADMIEDVLTGRFRGVIPLEGEVAEAMYYEINGSATYPEGEELGLWRAIREIHHRRLERGA
jgi:hypothetical protein